jgi:hypothetical protein
MEAKAMRVSAEREEEVMQKDEFVELLVAMVRFGGGDDDVAEVDACVQRLRGY